MEYLHFHYYRKFYCAFSHSVPSYAATVLILKREFYLFELDKMESYVLFCVRFILLNNILVIHQYSFVNLLFTQLSLFSHSVVSDSLRSHGLQLTRLPCPSPSPGVCSLSHWVVDGHPTISSSVIPFSSCLQSVLMVEFKSFILCLCFFIYLSMISKFAPWT